MGEPLQNWEKLKSVISLLESDFAFKISSRRITVSSSGLIPGLKKLGDESSVNLALSLNATTDEQELLPVLQRLAHAHEHDVREAAFLAVELRSHALGMKNLPDDFPDFEVALESEQRRRAEGAADRAAHLRGNAQRDAVVFGDEHALDAVAAADFKEPLHRAVARALLARDLRELDLEALVQSAAEVLGDVAHLVEVVDALVVDPQEELLRTEALLAEVDDGVLKILRPEVEQVAPGIRRGRLGGDFLCDLAHLSALRELA